MRFCNAWSGSYFWGMLCRACERGDYCFVAGYLSARWGLELTAEQVEPLVKMAWNMTQFASGISDGTLLMVIKNRAEDAGLFRYGEEADLFPRNRVSLHMAFLYIEETDEQLRRLRTVDKTEKKKAGPSTPGIERNVKILEPIDRVAFRVTR